MVGQQKSKNEDNFASDTIQSALIFAVIIIRYY